MRKFTMNMDRVMLSHRDDNRDGSILNHGNQSVGNAGFVESTLPATLNNRSNVHFIDSTRVYANFPVGNGDRLLDMHRTEHSGSIVPTVIANGTDILDEKVNLGGMIFMCNKRTKKDCFQHSLFGLPFNRWESVKQVVPGMVLFLFEYEKRQMWGIYEAASNGELNIEPNAYMDWRGSFPAQVRFREIENCPPLEEDEFKEAILDNYISDVKFTFELSSYQVRRLCEIFLWKTLQKCTYVDHCPDKAKQAQDHIPRLENMHDFESLEVEEYFPIGIDEITRQNIYKGHLHAMPDYGTAGQLRVDQHTKYHESLSDYFDKRLLGVKDDEENGYLLKSRTSGFPGSYMNDVPENKGDGSQYDAKQGLYPPLSRGAYVFDASHVEEASKVDNKTRPFMDFYRTPLVLNDVVDTKQIIHEHTTGEEIKRMFRAALGPDAYRGEFPLLYADTANHRRSVWSRISGREKASHASPRDRSAENSFEIPKHTTTVGTHDRLAKSMACDGDSLNPFNLTGGVLEGDLVSNQPEVSVNFKRRKNARNSGVTEELEKTHEKKRRKLIRPDLSDCTQVHKDKEFGSLHTENTEHILEVQEPKNTATSNSDSPCLQSSDLLQRSIEDKPPLCSLKRGHDCDVESRTGSKGQGSHADKQLDSSSRLAEDFFAVDVLGDKCNLKKGILKQRETKVDKAGDLKVSEGPLLPNGFLEKADTERAATNTDRTDFEFRILSNADVLNASGAVSSKDVGIIDLNQPFYPTCNDSEYFEHCFIGDGNDITHNQSSITINNGLDGENADSHPCLYLELTMAPNGPLPVAMLDTSDTSEKKGQVIGGI